jgi:hypothetical protein
MRSLQDVLHHPDRNRDRLHQQSELAKLTTSVWRGLKLTTKPAEPHKFWGPPRRAVTTQADAYAHAHTHLAPDLTGMAAVATQPTPIPAGGTAAANMQQANGGGLGGAGGGGPGHEQQQAGPDGNGNGNGNTNSHTQHQQHHAQLRPDNFQVVRTLGTGESSDVVLVCLPHHRMRMLRTNLGGERHVCARLSCAPQECAK